ncbi:MAG: ATP-binding cassette domain-containing protein [Nitrospirae bacterium]|nr:ATP-binding cassette domain-containing protein [Nitrospirota bacterium]
MYPSETVTVLNASGYVVAERKAAVSSKITGRLVSINVEEGSRIKKGDILARLENDDVIAAIDHAESGTIRVGGVDITSLNDRELSRWRATHVGFIFQFYNLIPVLSAQENVELPLILTNLSKKERLQHATEALRVVNLLDRARHYPSQLSGGQQQRVAIARAIVTDPTIIVADEPTGDLDRHSAKDILELMTILNAQHGKTIIMVTHDPRAAEKAHIVRNFDKGVLTECIENPNAARKT